MKNKDRRWLYIAILSLVVAVTWVGVSAAARLRKSTVPADLEKVLKPLDPTIDTTVFSDLAKHKGGGAP